MIEEEEKSLSDAEVMKFRSLVTATASAFYRLLPPAQVDFEDLVSECWVALIMLLPRYDFSRGSVPSFLVPRMRGAMQDYLRKQDPLTRSQRKLIRDIDTARISLSFLFSREPTRSEIAQEINVDISVLDSILRSQSSSAKESLDMIFQGEYSLAALVRDPSADAPFLSIMKGERSVLLRSLLDRLPKNQRFVLISRYFLEIRLNDAAKILGVTESRASQLHTQGLESLRVLASECSTDLQDLKTA